MNLFNFFVNLHLLINDFTFDVIYTWTILQYIRRYNCWLSEEMFDCSVHRIHYWLSNQPVLQCLKRLNAIR
jgi:hypothetical protein